MAKKKKRKSQSKRPPAPAGGTARSAASQGSGSSTPKKGYTPPKGGATPKREGGPPRPGSRRGSRLSPTMSWVLLGGGIVAIVAVVVILAVSGGDGGTGVTTREAWDLPALDNDQDPDGRVTLAEFSGTPTIVNFFASWCTACDRELPAFRELARQYEGEVDVVFVNSNETGNWRPMAEKNGIDEGFTLAKDIGGGNRSGLYRSLGGTGGMPITGFYDADGTFLEVNFGEMTFESATELMVQLGMVTPERAGLA